MEIIPLAEESEDTEPAVNENMEIIPPTEDSQNTVNTDIVGDTEAIPSVDEGQVTIPIVVDEITETNLAAENSQQTPPTAPAVDEQIVETDATEPSNRCPFANNRDRDIFTQKVLAIFLLQIIAEGVFIYNSRFFYSWHISNLRIAAVIVGVVLYVVPLLLMAFSDCCDQARKRSPYNYIILVYYPAVIAVLLMILATHSTWHYSSWGENRVIITIIQAWKNYVLAALASLIFSTCTANTKQVFSLRNNIYLGTGVFAGAYFFTLPFLDNTFGPFPILYMSLFLYVCYVYVLYDIHMMTGSHYHRAITPADYINGAVNLQIDYIIIIVKIIRYCFKCNPTTNANECNVQNEGNRILN